MSSNYLHLTVVHTVLSVAICHCVYMLQNIVMARVTRGFDRADSTNLPYVDTFMMLDFMKGKTEFVASEMRGVKTER